ncbi:hypothetical protein Tco_1519067, partial [Tanacetum coccineum]
CVDLSILATTLNRVGRSILNGIYKSLCWKSTIMTSILKAKQRASMTKQKAEVTCYECGELGHYKNGYPILKYQNRVDNYWKGKAREDSSAMTLNVNV